MPPIRRAPRAEKHLLDLSQFPGKNTSNSLPETSQFLPDKASCSTDLPNPPAPRDTILLSARGSEDPSRAT